MKQQLPYLNQTVLSPDKTPCKVLNVMLLSFAKAPIGRKSSTTLVKRAQHNEKIVTYNNNGQIESVAYSNKGDAIFENSPTDRYIPRDSDGNPFKFECVEKYGYQITEQGSNYCLVKSKKYAKLLVGCIKEPTCILNAFGTGSHQFLFEGATLKQDISSGKVTGIDKQAFETTWEICNQEHQLF